MHVLVRWAKVKRRTGMLLLLAAAMVAGLAGGLVWATHSDSAAPDLAPIQSNYGVDEAKGFARFPIYNAGDSVDGYPLVGLLHDTHPTEVVSFIYGDCTPPRAPDGSYDGGCGPPVQVQVWPACLRNPTLYGGASGSPAPVRTTLRGLPAASFEGGNRLEIQTGTSTVVIFADSPAKVAAALRGVNNTVPTGVDLPAPAAGAMTGDLVCRATPEASFTRR
jgi:hypothetical protein